jgi:NhaP-type Na+/H+ or K+/H+ antiporter
LISGLIFLSVTVTYVVVLFSILVQGLTPARVLRLKKPAVNSPGKH